MPVSLKSKLSKLRHNGQITPEEYDALIKKVDGHDKELVKQFKDKLIEKLQARRRSMIRINKIGHSVKYVEGVVDGLLSAIEAIKEEGEQNE